jgi:DNA polymerase-3 subunit delta
VTVYAGQKQVSRKDIDAVTVPVLEAQIYKMTDALAEKDFDRAAMLMNHLFQLNTEPGYINATIGGQLRKLYAAFLVKKSGGGADAYNQLTGSTSAYAARQNLRICGSFREDWYLRMIRLSAETELRIRSSSMDPSDLVRSLFAAMAAEA